MIGKCLPKLSLAISLPTQSPMESELFLPWSRLFT